MPTNGNSDRLEVHGIEFHGLHGVAPEERRIGNRFRVDLAFELDLRPAGENDDLTRSVDYAAAAARVVQIGTGPAVQLIETLAERMAGTLLAEFALIDTVEVRVTKLLPPAVPSFAASSVIIRRAR
jgi:7,8-dihydroneopterin aldolase/epimerase/oxygenase